MVDTVDKATINQAASSIWFHHRKGRLTASMNNQLKMKNLNTEKGLLSAAQHLVNGLSTKNKVLQLKLLHGKFYEPIALSKYEQYMKSINHDIQVEKSGFVIDYRNFVLGASPDSKVVDLLEDPVYGLVEIKCCEEY